MFKKPTYSPLPVNKMADTKRATPIGREIAETNEPAQALALKVVSIEERLYALSESTSLRFSSLTEKMVAALFAAEKAVEKASYAQERVNVGQNEFRGQLKDQAQTLATKEFADGLDKRLQTLEKVGASTSGRGDLTKVLWGIAGTVFGAVVIYVITNFLARVH